MSINVDFYGANKPRKAIVKRPTVTAVNLSGKDMRQHERMMEYGHQVNRINADFRSAMASLMVANQDIDRLQSENASMRAEIERLQGELKNEREKSVKLGKKNQKAQRPSVEAETAAV